MDIKAPQVPLPTLLPNTWTPNTLTTPFGSFGTLDEQLAALKSAGQEQVDNWDILTQLSGAILAGLHDLFGYPIQTAVYAVQAYVDYKKGADAQYKELADKPNPLFAKYGLAAGSSNKVTKAYLVNRRWKKMGGSAVQIAGNLSSLNPINLHQNIPGAVYHGHATTLTALHIAKLEALAVQFSLNEDLRDWIMVVRIAKLTKLLIRSGQLAGAIIPAASLPTSVVAAALKVGVKMTYAAACYAAAAKLHFAAHLARNPVTQIPYTGRAAGPSPLQRTNSAPASLAGTANPALRRTNSAPGGGAGLSPLQRTNSAPGALAGTAVPALRRTMSADGRELAFPIPTIRTDGAYEVVDEIFTRRTARHIPWMGGYNVEAIVAEPAGWLAIADKLMLI